MIRRVEIIEVSPRDGIQNEKTLLSTAQKVDLIRRAIDAGIGRLEVASFVNPKRVPQMADAEAVMAALPRDGRARYIGLALNRRGYDRAVAAGVDEVNFVVVASETFNQRNQGAAIDATMGQFAEIAEGAAADGVSLGLTIGASFGCPFEGEVPVDRVVGLAQRAATLGASEIALADTIGVAAPTDITERVAAVKSAIGDRPLRIHLHNTRNTGIANAYAAVEAGVERIDSSIGGVGGCPFAPAATGNIPTEDLVYMLDRMGVATGVDAAKLIDTATWLEQQLGITAPGMLHKAGLFPPDAKAA